MLVSRKTYEELRSRYRDALVRRNSAERAVERLERDNRDERKGHGETARALLASETEVKRLNERIRRLTDLLKRTQSDQGAEVAELTKAHEDEVNQLREELAKERRPRPLPPGNVTQLGLCERARRSLEAKVAELQASNDAMSRELVDRAGTLKAVRPTGHEPGVVS